MGVEAGKGLEGLYPIIHERIRSLPKTNWWVITGGPNSGKSPLINHLSFQGIRTIPEAARVLIDEEISQGKTLKEIRSNEAAFQRKVFRMKRDPEKTIRPDELYFFDRGKGGDDMAYWMNAIERHTVVSTPVNFLYGVAIASEIRFRYAGIFLLQKLPRHEKDYARPEDEAEAIHIADLLNHYYGAFLGYPIVDVPVLSISQRAQFILDHVKSAGNMLA